MLTGFLSSSGIDLSYIFVSGTTPTNSGYKLVNGNDLSSIFASNTSGSFAANTGYLIIDNRDISRLYEPIPTSVSITNFNFSSPATGNYTVVTGLLPGWTTTAYPHVIVGYGSAGTFNKVALPSPYTQYCILLNNNSNGNADVSISQNIQMPNLNYLLSFWIIGRNGSGTGFTLPSQIKVTIDNTEIYISTLSHPATWMNVVQYFTLSSTGLKNLKFENLGDGETSILITGITIRYEIPTSVSINNFNFILPATTNYTAVTTATLIGWTAVNNVSVGYGSSGAFNQVALPSPYTQYCVLQHYNILASISQNIQIFNLNCRLSFWIIGRNSGTVINNFSTTTQVQVMIDTTEIYKSTLSQPLIWTNIVQTFTVTSTGIKNLKFTNLTTSGDSSFLITGITITYI